MGHKKSLGVKKYVSLMGTALVLAGTLVVGDMPEASASSWDVKINQTQEEISQKLKEVGSVKEDLKVLEEEINEQEGKIGDAEEVIEEKEEEVKSRIGKVGNQLKAMQKSEINQNIIVTILNSESITEAINTIYKVKVLNGANEKNIKGAIQESEELVTLKQELVEVKEDLGDKKESTEEVKAKLDSEVASLNKTLAENKRQKEEEIKRVEEARQKALAAKEAEKKVKTASSSSKSVTVGSKSSPAPASATAKSGWMTFESTAYSTNQPGLSTHTAMGVDLRQNPRVVAVDPNVIPLGTKIEIEGMGVYLAADTGGAIKGRIIDVHFSDVSKLRPWGRRNVNIRIVN